MYYNATMIYHAVTTQKLEEIATEFARTLHGGEVIVLQGDLGAGKTTFTKALACALGVREVVTSPTFTFLRSYRGDKLRLHHFDLYRAEDEDSLYELGLAEYLGNPDSVCVIEWNCFTDLTDPIVIRISGAGDEPREIEFV